jgi:hypothetical protein
MFPSVRCAFSSPYALAIALNVVDYVRHVVDGDAWFVIVACV